MKKQVLSLMILGLTSQNGLASNTTDKKIKEEPVAASERIDVKEIGRKPVFAGKMDARGGSDVQILNNYMSQIWLAIKEQDNKKFDDLFNNPPLPSIDKDYVLTIALAEAVYLGNLKMIEYMVSKKTAIIGHPQSSIWLGGQTLLQITARLAEKLGGIYIKINQYLIAQMMLVRDVLAIKSELKSGIKFIQDSLQKLHVKDVQSKKKLNRLKMELEILDQATRNEYEKSELIKQLKKLNIIRGQVISLTPVKKESEKRMLAESKYPNAFATNALLIFLDDSENELDAISLKFMEAIHEKAGPILVSWHIFRNVFGRPSLSQLIKRNEASAKILFTKQRYDAIVKELHALILPGQKLDKQAVANELNKKFPDIKKGIALDALYLEIVGFNPQEWIIRESAEFDLVLLIPDPKGVKRTGFNPQKNTDKAYYTSSELVLGLKFNHWDDLSEKKFNEMVGYTEKFRAPQSLRYKQNFDQALAHLLISRNEYRINKILPTDMVRWAIYMNGHGGIETQTVGLPIAQFKKCLDFFDNTVVVSLLVYSSCFATGMNSETIYKEITEHKNTKDKTYSYTIVTSGIADSPQATYRLKGLENFVPGIIDFIQKNLRIVRNFNFVEFIRLVTEYQAVDFPAALSNVLQTTGQMRETAQIRLPELAWFDVLDFNNHVVSITNTMAKTQNKPLSIKKLFATKTKKPASNLQGILLYASIIPFELIIDTEKAPKTEYVSIRDTLVMPNIVSMLPGVSMLHIKKISVPTKASLNDIFKALLQDEHFDVQKIIWVDELEIARQNVWMDMYEFPISKLQDVIVTGYIDSEMGIKRRDILFKYNGASYNFNLYANNATADTEEKHTEWRESLEKNSAETFKQFEEERAGIQRLGDIKKAAAIKIQKEASKYKLEDAKYKASKKQDSKSKIDVKKDDALKK